MAAHLFCHKLIDAQIFDKIYSILPVIPITKEELNYERNVIPMYSCLRNNYILSRIAFLWESIRLMNNIPKHSVIWFYNLPFISVFLFWSLKIFKPSVSLNVILLDYTPGKKGLEGLKEKFLLYSINKSNGIIRLANSSFIENKNTFCLPGVVSTTDEKQPEILVIKKSFLISGALGNNIAMLPLLLDVFSLLPDMQLHITGKASDLNLIKQYTNQYSNIIYHGMVEYDEYLKILHDTPFLLSTRNPNAPENQCNFPSKIIEALLHNRIIISTIHYEQLDGIRYFETPATKDGFIKSLQQIMQLPQAELLKYANQAEEVKQRFNTNVWKTWMKKIERKQV